MEINQLVCVNIISQMAGIESYLVLLTLLLKLVFSDPAISPSSFFFLQVPKMLPQFIYLLFILFPNCN